MFKSEIISGSIPDSPSMLTTKELMKEINRAGYSAATGRHQLDFDEIRFNRIETSRFNRKDA